MIVTKIRHILAVSSTESICTNAAIRSGSTRWAIFTHSSISANVRMTFTIIWTRKLYDVMITSSPFLKIILFCGYVTWTFSSEKVGRHLILLCLFVLLILCACNENKKWEHRIFFLSRITKNFWVKGISN